MENFVDRYGTLFDAVYTRGVTEGDDFVASPSDDLIIASVRNRYLLDASLVIVLLGESTWSRRFIDWEIAAALGGPHGEPLAVAAFTIGEPSATKLPPRLATLAPCPATVHCLPTSDEQLLGAIASTLTRQGVPASSTPLLRTDIRP